MRTAAAVGALAAAAAAAYLGASLYGAERITHRRQLPCEVEPESIAAASEEVRFPARDGLLLAGWWFPASGADRALVLIHGHGQNRIDRNWGTDTIARAFLPRGFSVLAFDLRGHGVSPASRQSFGVREKQDVLGALDFVCSRGYPASRVAFLGISYGAASLLLAAPAMPEAGALIADSAFAAIWPVIDDKIPRQSPVLARLRPGKGIRLAARLLHGIDLRRAAPLSAMPAIAQPVLFIHGEEDTYVPPHHSRQLFAASRHPHSELWLVPGAQHAQTVSVNPAAFINKVARHLDAQIAPVEPVRR